MGEPRDVRSSLQNYDAAYIVKPLSQEVEKLLKIPRKDLLLATKNLLKSKHSILFKGPGPDSSMVLQLSNTIVVKIARVDTTQYTSMEYIKEHESSIPAPIPHGLIEMTQLQRKLRYSLIFMSYIQGQDLEEVWPQLTSNEKKDISTQLGSIISDLRHLSFSENQVFGGIGGEGCKDARRDVRTFPQTIIILAAFEDAVYLKPRSNGSVYFNYLDDACPKNPLPDRVFTHGDLRMGNIKVQKLVKWTIVGILDWEFSGVYPGYWEVIKATNLLTPWTKSDWYNYLKSYTLPGYHHEWCRDRMLNQQVDS